MWSSETAGYTSAWITAATPAQTNGQPAVRLATPRTIQLQRAGRARTSSLLSGLPFRGLLFLFNVFWDVIGWIIYKKNELSRI